MLNLQSCNIFSQRNNSTSFSVCARKHKLLLLDEIFVLLFHCHLFHYTSINYIGITRNILWFSFLQYLSDLSFARSSVTLHSSEKGTVNLF